MLNEKEGEGGGAAVPQPEPEAAAGVGAAVALVRTRSAEERRRLAAAESVARLDAACEAALGLELAVVRIADEVAAGEGAAGVP